MYASPFPHYRLGEFEIPSGQDWVKTLRYIPRPPLAIRGSLNPWQQERTRVLWQAEEAAWRAIQKLQADYRAVEAKMLSAIARFNQTVEEMESRIGRKSGISKLSTYGSAVGFVPGFNIAGAILSFIGFIGGMFEAKKKKKQAQHYAALLTAIQHEIEGYQNKLVEIQKLVAYQTSVTDRVKSEQAELVTQDLERNRMKIASRQEQDARAGAYRRALYEQTRQAAPFRVVSPQQTGDL